MVWRIVEDIFVNISRVTVMNQLMIWWCLTAWDSVKFIKHEKQCEDHPFHDMLTKAQTETLECLIFHCSSISRSCFLIRVIMKVFQNHWYLSKTSKQWTTTESTAQQLILSTYSNWSKNKVTSLEQVYMIVTSVNYLISRSLISSQYVTLASINCLNFRYTQCRRIKYSSLHEICSHLGFV